MKREDLSAEDQKLLSTDFGDLDKVAAEQVKVANEMYEAGVDMAQATADGMDKAAAEDEAKEDDEDDEGDESEKKAAADYGNIITEGFLDKLAALGEERHGNPDHYFMPFIEEKVAEAGARAALQKFAGMVDSIANKLPTRAGMALLGAAEKAPKALGKAKAHVSQAAQRAGDAAKRVGKMHSEGAKDFMTGIKGKTEHVTGLSAGERARRVGSGLGKMSPAIAAGGAAAGGTAYAATRGKKDAPA